MGDFNLDLLKCNSNNAALELMGVCHSKWFFNTITKPTRVTDGTATLIDHIWSTDITNNKANGIIFSRISDHFPIFSVYQNNSGSSNSFNRNTFTEINSRIFSEENISNFRNCLNNVSWDLIYASDDPSICFRTFQLIFSACFNRYFPIVTRNIKSKSLKKPYITPEIRSLIAERNKIQRKYAKWPITYGNAYRSIRNRVTQIIRVAKGNYFKQQLNKYSNNLKKYWKVVDNILCRNKPNSKNNQFKINNNIITDSNEIANNFNNYFVGVGEGLAEQCRNHGTDYHEYLGNRRNGEFQFPLVTENKIIKVVEGMKNAAAGVDDVPMQVLKKVIVELSPVLTYLCNLSFNSGIFPNELEIAKVLPYFKSGDKSLINNYRPISVLPAFSKVFEKIACDSLKQYCISNSIITSSQFGFMEGKNTEDAILTFTHDIIQGFDEGMFTVGVFLDLSKAFDTVDHGILLSKLEHYGIRNNTLEWFLSYLSNRKQYVSYNGAKSSLQRIKYGVPQGSILGPVLFLLYINDIVNASNLLKYILFADDSNLYFSHSDINFLITIINQELKKILTWINSNKLTLNLSKTHYIVFNRKKLPPNLRDVRIGTKILERVDNTKFLGVIIQDDLRWHMHIQNISKKIDKLSGILHLTRGLLTENSLKHIYNTLAYPNLIYCQAVWGSAGPSILKPLVTSQKRIIRTVTGATRLQHTNSIFNDLKLLKLVDINTYCTALYVYKSINNITENRYFINRNNQYHALRGSHLLALPRAKSSQSQKSMHYHGVKIWNSLPSNTRNAASLPAFKKSLKDNLLNKYNGL